MFPQRRCWWITNAEYRRFWNIEHRMLNTEYRNEYFPTSSFDIGHSKLTKKAHHLTTTGFYKIWHRPTLPHFTAVPSALAGLTSLFGMGRGGHRRYRHLNIFSEWLIGEWWVVLLCRSLIKLIHNILFCLSFIPDPQLPMNYWTSELINFKHNWKK